MATATPTPPPARSAHRPTTAGSVLVILLALLLHLLAAPPAQADTTPTDDPTAAAAGWLVSALTDDPAVDSEFGPTAGQTIDVLFALAAVGVAAETIEAMADWLEGEVAAYTQGEGFDAEDAAYAGATAKLALALQVVDRDPSDVGGIDLLAQLTDLEGQDGEPVGRFSDRGEFDDFSTPLTQSLALLALDRAADREPSDAAVRALLDAACPDGGFPDAFGAADDPDTCASSVDTTGYAVQALAHLGEQAAAEQAGAWLLDVQADDGSFGTEDGANSNSTGLAAAALALLGESDAAERAVSWTLVLQQGCDDDQPGAIPFSPQEPGAVELATAQAVLGATGAGLGDLDATDAVTEVPALDCDEVEDADAAEEAAPTEDEAGEEDAAVDEEPTGDEAEPDTDLAAGGAADDGGPLLWVLAVVVALLAVVGWLLLRRRGAAESPSDTAG